VVEYSNSNKVYSTNLN